MNASIIRFIDTFAKAIKDDHAAVFAGAGLSIPAGFVNWRELLREIAEELNLDIKREHDLVAIAQYHLNERGNNRSRLNQLLLEEFTHNADITNNHKILASLPIPCFWTTNYDKLIERALTEADKIPDVKITQDSLSTNLRRRDAVVYKMHGDISMPEHAVITKDDYETYNEKRMLFSTALQGDLVSKTFLFVGFSFDDPNLEYVLSRIRVLLGTNQREHFCFFKKVSRDDFDTDIDYYYACVKQDLKVKDLRRYSIHALLVDSYSSITQILAAIQTKVYRSNIFISGTASNFSPRDFDESMDFTRHLSQSLATHGFKIISGFGQNVGSAVIDGVLQTIFLDKRRRMDDSLTLRPFPQIDTKNKEVTYKKYRAEMVKQSGIAIFIFGNKKHGDITVPAEGMLEEFEAALLNNVIPIPVGATGWVSEDLWNRVTQNFTDFYPDNPELREIVLTLGEHEGDLKKMVPRILRAVELLQKLFF
ncbi:hypothetical protein DYBT9275_04687 [Dyadobacter sp. CECT 9275]|uniref:NAD(+) hydrolase ThsA n=1 Tax=Dyadobacter helix TaxID=2822344 RepID=A0A916JFW3_9BACT|nr:SIR2 family protein [Dyadobacter sp. CECT 9275]CAG5010303.1 hypothetical protein DYBT9275_04687 [Dyadobacter sp. CECT 9275]